MDDAIYLPTYLEGEVRVKLKCIIRISYVETEMAPKKKPDTYQAPCETPTRHQPGTVEYPRESPPLGLRGSLGASASLFS